MYTKTRNFARIRRRTNDELQRFARSERNRNGRDETSRFVSRISICRGDVWHKHVLDVGVIVLQISSESAMNKARTAVTNPDPTGSGSQQ